MAHGVHGVHGVQGVHGGRTQGIAPTDDSAWPNMAHRGVHHGVHGGRWVMAHGVYRAFPRITVRFQPNVMGLHRYMRGYVQAPARCE